MKPLDQIADEIIREADDADVGGFRVLLKAGIVNAIRDAEKRGRDEYRDQAEKLNRANSQK